MDVRWNTVDLSRWPAESVRATDVASLLQFLEAQGTFRFAALPNGLFPAASGDAEDHSTTGYSNVWVRDNIQIAWAHHVVQPDSAAAADCIRGLMSFYTRHRYRFRNIIEGRADDRDPMNRPHIRFDGNNLKELIEKWSHAQNDALGYFLWLTCRLLREKRLQAADVNREILADLVRYWQVIRYWEDEDSGHWEETRKVAASSIGTAVAGLSELSLLISQPDYADWLLSTEAAVSPKEVYQLTEQGRAALNRILPAECVQNDPAKKRDYDAALLFLIYPLEIVDESMADQILANVKQHLLGEYGIRRYLGDSYWCANYKQLLSADVRTSDFSDDLSQRDAMLKPGTEAQWCIFDPIISCIYARRYARSNSPADLQQQIHFLRRSLGQMTTSASRFGAWRCPESYYLEGDQRVPNDITPLLWTQANLWQALVMFQESL
jgi:hypothetical protein